MRAKIERNINLCRDRDKKKSWAALAVIYEVDRSTAREIYSKKGRWIVLRRLRREGRAV